jgi:hypothetical protein
LPPVVERLTGFAPESVSADHFRAMLPGSRARFSLRFWNLEEAELQRLVWCLALEEGLGHKIGKHRYLGLGSLRLHILPASHLTDWVGRYTGAGEQGNLPFDPAQWRNPAVVKHLDELRPALTLRFGGP